MSEFGGMPGRVFAYSAAFHLAVVATLYTLVHWHLFDRRIEEETPLVVQLVNVAPETRATQVNRTPPKPDKPEQVAEVETPKPPEPKPEPPKPQPPPEAKPEPPKAEAPKPPPPEPKPQEAKAEPEPPKPPPPKPEPPKKKEEVLSDEMLRNLAKRSPTRTAEEAPKQVAAAPATSSQPIARLGPQLTTSELDLIKQQLRECWLIPAGARDAKNLTPEFRVYMNQDGTIRSATQLNPERNSDPFFQAAAEAAARALRNPRCQPLKLPREKYDQWQTFVITFDPKDLL